jgi:hypothetical protein
MVRLMLSAMILATVVGLVPVHAASGLDMQEGMWEITSQVKMQGMTVPAMTYSQCITKEDAIPQNSSPQQNNCKISDVKTVGSTVSWSIVCKEQTGDIKGNGSITYHGDRFEGQVTMEYAGMVMVTEMNGKRVGPCTE